MCVCVCMRMCTHCDSSYLEVGVCVCLRACVCVCVHMCTHCDSSYLVVGVCVCVRTHTHCYILLLYLGSF